MSLRGKQANGLVTQQRVLRAAVAQFLEKGYTGTTTADITGAAGIAQSSFFHVFPSKEALLLELVRRMFGGQFDLAGQHSGAAAPCSSMRWKRRFHFLLPRRKGRQEA